MKVSKIILRKNGMMIWNDFKQGDFSKINSLKEYSDLLEDNKKLLWLRSKDNKDFKIIINKLIETDIDWYKKCEMLTIMLSSLKKYDKLIRYGFNELNESVGNSVYTFLEAWVKADKNDFIQKMTSSYRSDVSIFISEKSKSIFWKIKQEEILNLKEEDLNKLIFENKDQSLLIKKDILQYFLGDNKEEARKNHYYIESMNTYTNSQSTFLRVRLKDFELSNNDILNVIIFNVKAKNKLNPKLFYDFLREESLLKKITPKETVRNKIKL